MKELFELPDFQLEKEEDVRVEQEVSAIKKNLSEYRYLHSLEVAMVGLQLWKEFFSDDVSLRNRVLHAALLHDVTKELKTKEHLQIAKTHNLLFELERLPLSLYHAFTGALVAQDTFAHKDNDILLAIHYHTTGACCMPACAQIIYTADYLASSKISWKKIKPVTFDGLVFLKTQHTIQKLSQKKLPIDKNTYELYQSLTEKKL